MSAPTGFISLKDHQDLIAVTKAQEFAAGMLKMRSLMDENSPQRGDPRAIAKLLVAELRNVLPLVGIPVPPVIDGALDLADGLL